MPTLFFHLGSGKPLVGRYFAQLQQLKDGFSQALMVLFMVGFFWGVTKIREESGVFIASVKPSAFQ